MDKPLNEVKHEEMKKGCAEEIIQSGGSQIPTVLINISMTQLAEMQRKMVQSVDLLQAARSGDAEECRRLVAGGVDPNVRNKQAAHTPPYRCTIWAC
jgi:hypothetical protein